MSDTFNKGPDIRNIFGTGGIFFEFFKTIPNWLSNIPFIGWSFEWIAFIVIRILSILGIPLRIIMLAFTDPTKFLKIIGDFFTGLMDKLTLFTNWSVIKFILWSCTIFLIISFVPFRKTFEQFNKSNKAFYGYFALLALLIFIPTSMFMNFGWKTMFEKMTKIIKNFPTGTNFTPGYYWPNLLFYTILILSPLIVWLTGSTVIRDPNGNIRFDAPNPPNTSRFEQILTGLLNIPGVLFTLPIFGLTLFALIALYYSYNMVSTFKSFTSANDILNLIITGLLLIGLIYCVYNIYSRAMPTGANLNTTLITSFMLSVLLFLINILTPFLPNLPGIPGLNQLLLVFFGLCVFFISFVLVQGVNSVTNNKFANYITNNKYKFWGLYSFVLFTINYLLNNVRERKWSTFFENKSRDCKEENSDENSSDYRRCMKETKEDDKINKNVSLMVMVMSIIMILFGGILIDAQKFFNFLNNDNFVLFLFSLLIILAFCFIVFQSYSEKYNKKVNEDGETINQKYEQDDVITKDAYVTGNFIFTAAATLIILSLMGSVGGLKIGNTYYDKNYSRSEKMSWLSKIRSRILKIALYGFSFYTFFYFIGKTFNSTVDNNTFNNIFVILGGGVLLSLAYFFGDKLFPDTGFTRIIMNMVLIIPCLCQLLLVNIFQDVKNTPSIVYLILLVELVLVGIYLLTSVLGKFYVEDYFIIRNEKTKFDITGSTIREHGNNTCNKKYGNKGITGKVTTKKKGSIEKTIKILDNAQYLDRETTPGYVDRKGNKPGDELCMKQTYRHRSVKATKIKPDNLGNEPCEMFTLDKLLSNNVNVNQNYNYALSFWTFFHSQSSGFRESYNKYTNILNFGSYPIIDYNMSTNTLRVRIGVRLPEKCRTGNRDTCCDKTKAKKSVNGKELNGNDLKMIELWCRENMTIGNPVPDEHLLTVFEKEGLLKTQKWNNIVINYDLGVLDIFVNSQLVGSWKHIVSYQTSKKIKIGEFDGIAGGICNAMYYPSAINLFQIKKHYNLLKNKNPPII